LLITRRSQVQILPPLPMSSQVRGPLPLGEGLLRVARDQIRDQITDQRRLRRNAELRFVGHSATGRDTWDAVAGSKPSGRTWDRGSQVFGWHPPVVGNIGADGGIVLSSWSQVRDGGRKAIGLPARVEAAPTWHKYGLRRSVVGSLPAS
jgi:hypothetical protein